MDLNILIVDDSGVMRKILINLLKLSGLSMGRIAEAANGQEALQILAQGGIGLVLADIHMPVMDGIEMFERLRADPRHIALPFVFVSSDSSSTRIHTLLDQGAGFVHKPLSPELLLEAITQVTSGPGGDREC